ncbi:MULTISPECIES: YccF domain-containing protein, partial [Corallococcus]|uniref:YccF domain-containing protein n=1 Tax=Corallococcus TaxID=83461 RepID=UPI0026575B1D
MNLLLNLLWIIFGGGLVLCLEYLLGGLVLCLTLVGIPFGVQCFKMAGLALMPFGKDIEDLPSAGAMSFGLNIVTVRPTMCREGLPGERFAADASGHGEAGGEAGVGAHRGSLRG